MQWNPFDIAKQKDGFGTVIQRQALSGSSCYVIHVETLEALIQYIGYLKYISDGLVLFRGQQKLYDPFVPLPSLLRSDSQSTAAEKMYELVNMTCCWKSEPNPCDNMPFLDSSSADGKGIFDFGVKQYAIEPLFQHYGINTRWLDLTDSIPFALCFGLIEYNDRASSLNTPNEYLRYQLDRDTSCYSKLLQNTITRERKASEDDDFVYLYAIEIKGRVRKEKDTQIERFENGWIIDARREIPSFFLRPHIQHGLLFFSPYFSKTHPVKLYSEPIRTALFEIPAKSARQWLGAGKMFSLGSLYPLGRTSVIAENEKARILDAGLFQFEQKLLNLRRKELTKSTFPSERWNSDYDITDVLSTFSRIVNFVPEQQTSKH